MTIALATVHFNREKAAHELIRAGDLYRLLRAYGRSTNTDKLALQRAVADYEELTAACRWR